ncbi:MAG: tetratricopeptide repeat protein [Muribaculaceae bacterium]|nr:tetratricopeptide repeat protein [Muribaculaceae bacterium]
MFDNAMDMKDKNRIDSILAQWEDSAPDDSDLLIAKFNRLMMDIYKPVITKSKNKDVDNDSSYLITIDHVLDNNKIAEAYLIINKAIEDNPDQFKLRQKKIFTDYKMNFYGEFIKDFDHAFKQQLKNNGKWIVDDSYYPDLPRDEVLTSLAVGYLNDIIDKDNVDVDLAEQLLDTGLNYFPNEFRLLNIYGIIAINYRDDPESAIAYYNKALTIAPDDVLIMLNMAQAKLKIGDGNGAIELADKVILSPVAPKNYKEEAKEIIEYANLEKIPVSLYSFEFEYAPVLASKAKSPFQMTRVTSIIDERLPSAGFIPQFKSKIVSDSLLTFGDKECVLWTFDTPTEVPLCKYLVFIPVNDTYEVYTLEKTLPLKENINWVIGHLSTEGHSSCGGAKGFENGEEFVKYVIDNFVK